MLICYCSAAVKGLFAGAKADIATTKDSVDRAYLR